MEIVKSNDYLTKRIYNKMIELKNAQSDEYKHTSIDGYINNYIPSNEVLYGILNVISIVINETDEYEDLKALGLIHLIVESSINLKREKCEYRFEYQSKELEYESIEMVINFFERIEGLFRSYRLKDDTFALYITAYTAFNVGGKNSWLRSKVCETLKTSLSQVERSDAGTIIDIISGDSTTALAKINTVCLFSSHPEYNYKIEGGNNMLTYIVKFENREIAEQARARLIEVYGGISISKAYYDHEKEDMAHGLFEINGLDIDTISLMVYSVHSYNFTIMDVNYCDVKKFDIIDNYEQYLTQIVYHRFKNIYGSADEFIKDSKEDINGKILENLLDIFKTVLEKKLINSKFYNLLKVVIIILKHAVDIKKYRTDARFDDVIYDTDKIYHQLNDSDITMLAHFITRINKLFKSHDLNFEIFLLNVAAKSLHRNINKPRYLVDHVITQLSFDDDYAEEKKSDSELLTDIVSGNIDATAALFAIYAYKLKYEFKFYTYFNSYAGEVIPQKPVEKQSFTDDLELTPYEMAAAEKIAAEIVNNGLEAIPQECDSYSKVETEYEKRVRELEEVLTKSKHDVYMAFRQHPLYNYLNNKINLMNCHRLLDSEIHCNEDGFKFLCDYLHIEIPLLAVSTDFEKLTTKNINWTYEFNNMTCPVNYIMKQAKDEMMQKLGFYNSVKFDLLDEVIILDDDHYSEFNMNYYTYLGKIVDYSISMKKNIDNIISSMNYALMFIENIFINNCSLDYLDEIAKIEQEKKEKKEKGK